MNWEQYFKTTVTEMLKSAVVKAALSKLLVHGLIRVGGFKEWLVGTIIKYAFDELAVPLINYSIRKGMLVVDTQKGKVLLKNIERAKDENNIEDYLRNMSDV
jgi:hypothetical protein